MLDYALDEQRWVWGMDSIANKGYNWQKSNLLQLDHDLDVDEREAEWNFKISLNTFTKVVGSIKREDIYREKKI